jgi:hypothetical protein
VLYLKGLLQLSEIGWPLIHTELSFLS